MSSKQAVRPLAGIELNLPEFIRVVQDQLMESQLQREYLGLPALFRTRSLEIEASVLVTKSNDSKFGFDLKVISASNTDTTKDQAVQKIRVKFDVVNEDVLGLQPA